MSDDVAVAAVNTIDEESLLLTTPSRLGRCVDDANTASNYWWMAIEACNVRSSGRNKKSQKSHSAYALNVCARMGASSRTKRDYYALFWIKMWINDMLSRFRIWLYEHSVLVFIFHSSHWKIYYWLNTERFGFSACCWFGAGSFIFFLSWFIFLGALNIFRWLNVWFV